MPISRRFYKLVGREAVACPDIMDWATAMADIDTQVAVTSVGQQRVSTVFLGFDHAFGSAYGPTLFETMVFNAAGKPVQALRCSTWAEAEEQHAAVVWGLEGA